jgi:uncharacterized protein (DUF302 family)
MKLIQSLFLLTSFAILEACSPSSEKNTALSNQVDALASQVESEISTFKKITILDHHEMAEEEDVNIPPAILTIFSSPKVNATLLKKSQLIGLDLPFKVLVYSDTVRTKVAFTSAEFIQKRHGLAPYLLNDYSTAMEQALTSVPDDKIAKLDLSGLSAEYGIVKIKSEYDFTTTIQNLKDIVMSQEEAKGFADVDFQKEASEIDFPLLPNTLLLFGSNAQDGKSMADSPLLGLDAFCQKVLVFEDESGGVWIAFNDIIAFAELYYSRSSEVQQTTNASLIRTFKKAITISEVME